MIIKDGIAVDMHKAKGGRVPEQSQMYIFQIDRSCFIAMCLQ